MENISEVYEYYERHYEEDARLKDHPLEFIRSREIIGRYLLESPMVIADIAGGTGPYAFWLSGLGHYVHLLDLSQRHIELAKACGEDSGVRLASYALGDARALPYEDAMFDMLLLMGALYHLQEPQDRIQCIREAHRVLRPGGVLVTSYISRYASLLDGYKEDLIADPVFQGIVENDLLTGRHKNHGNLNYFTSAFLHTPGLVTEELRMGGFQNNTLFAVEGFAGVFDTSDALADAKRKAQLMEFLRMTEQIPELMGVSYHLLAVSSR